jgi:hypothetical protein
MSLSASLNALAVGRLLCSPQGRSSGRMPDPVIGSASRHGRLRASPGGALTGRDRPLQCKKVSKTTLSYARARRRWWGGWRPKAFWVTSKAAPDIEKRGPRLRPFLRASCSQMCRPTGRLFGFASSRRLLAKRRLPCFRVGGRLRP